MQTVKSSSATRDPMAHVVPTGKACGAEIRGVDLNNLDELTFSVIQQAIDDHLVLLFRGQRLDNEHLIKLGKHFGNFEPPGMSIIGKPYIDFRQSIY